MTMHLFGAVVTGHGPAANNRGETEGRSLSTLQKLLWNGDIHTTVSAEAIRWALRADWQVRGLNVNRFWQEEIRQHKFDDEKFENEGKDYIDDDVLGYMSAEAAKNEVDAELSDETPRQGRGGRTPKGKATVRRSRFETTRAVSLTPWAGDVVFSVGGAGATPAASKSGKDPTPYSIEVHATRYQYGFALTPTELHEPARARSVIDAITDLTEVAGNHAHFFYDFAPDTVIFRWTSDPAPRILYPFRLDAEGQLTVPELLRRLRAKDIEEGELVVGGSLTESPDGAELARLGAAMHAGVKAAAEDVKRRLAQVGA